MHPGLIEERSTGNRPHFLLIGRPCELTQGSPTTGPEDEMIMAACPQTAALIFSDYERQGEPG